MTSPASKTMRNIRLLLEYDGTAYAGWQIQPEDPTIQGTLKAAAEQLTNEEVIVYGASRTDAGVHALGQVATFTTRSAIEPKSIQRALNALLPHDIVVRRAEEVPRNFDPRRDARAKTYCYRILNRTHPAALERNRCWFVHHPLDLDAMRLAAAAFVGKKDFASFMATGSDVAHSVREVISATVERNGDIIEFEVCGTAFLRHMVRVMAGTLVEVGLGKLDSKDVARIIEAKDRKAAPRTAPAMGLYLLEIEYPSQTKAT